MDCQALRPYLLFSLGSNPISCHYEICKEAMGETLRLMRLFGHSFLPAPQPRLIHGRQRTQNHLSRKGNLLAVAIIPIRNSRSWIITGSQIMPFTLYGPGIRSKLFVPSSLGLVCITVWWFDILYKRLGGWCSFPIMNYSTWAFSIYGIDYSCHKDVWRTVSLYFTWI